MTANIANLFVTLVVILTVFVSLLADKYRCEANGYAVQGHAIEKSYGVKFIAFSLGLEPELVFPADKCRKLP